METSTVVWIVVVALVVIALIAVSATMANKKKHVRDRKQAAELREKASGTATEVQHKEALAKETEAKAAQARAEADRKAAEAERLEAEAQDRAGSAATHRDQHQEQLRKADDLDPDVQHAAPTTASSTTASSATDNPTTGNPATDETTGGTHRA